jgi:lycopene beta-cyclase
MREVLGLEDYFILEEEFGVIPMTDARYSDGRAGVFQIGTAGGQTKPSSGFTFSFIQKHCAAIIEALVAGTRVKRRRSNRFNVYDNVLLNVLYNDKLAADRVFGDLFRRNPAPRVLRFLDNDSSWIEELQIMRSVRTGVFLPAALQEMMRVK